MKLKHSISFTDANDNDYTIQRNSDDNLVLLDQYSEEVLTIPEKDIQQLIGLLENLWPAQRSVGYFDR